MTTIPTNAIYLDKDGHLSVRKIKSHYKPEGPQSLVQVHYSAVNPADLRHYFVGISEYVAGYEWAGTVLEVGPSSPFKPAQQLFGMTLLGDQRPMAAGAHQDFLLAEPEWTYHLPDGLDPQKAVTFPVAVQSSIDALFNQLGFGFPPAGVSGTNPTDKAILIWGGASALGQAGIQLAKAAGFAPIVTTASPRNHPLLKNLGATHCFDYRSATVVQDIRSSVHGAGKQLAVVYDAVATGLGLFEGLTAEEKAKVEAEYHKSSPAMARQCCDDGPELKLVASLIVEKDPEWKFPMPYRVAEGGRIPKPKGLEGFFEGMDPELGNRIRAVREWLLQDGANNWTPMNVRLVKGADAGIQAIKDVYAGKAGGVKVVIDRPL